MDHDAIDELATNLKNKCAVEEVSASHLKSTVTFSEIAKGIVQNFVVMEDSRADLAGKLFKELFPNGCMKQDGTPASEEDVKKGEEFKEWREAVKVLIGSFLSKDPTKGPHGQNLISAFDLYFLDSKAALDQFIQDKRIGAEMKQFDFRPIQQKLEQDRTKVKKHVLNLFTSIVKLWHLPGSEELRKQEKDKKKKPPKTPDCKIQEAHEVVKAKGSTGKKPDEAPSDAKPPAAKVLFSEKKAEDEEEDEAEEDDDEEEEDEAKEDEEDDDEGEDVAAEDTESEEEEDGDEKDNSMGSFIVEDDDDDDDIGVKDMVSLRASNAVSFHEAHSARMKFLMDRLFVFFGQFALRRRTNPTFIDPNDEDYLRDYIKEKGFKVEKRKITECRGDCRIVTIPAQQEIASVIEYCATAKVNCYLLTALDDLAEDCFFELSKKYFIRFLVCRCSHFKNDKDWKKELGGSVGWLCFNTGMQDSEKKGVYNVYKDSL
jgi:hypothetical protein